MIVNRESVKSLAQILLDSNIDKPIRLNIGLRKVSRDGMSRYMRVYLGNRDITKLVIGALDGKMSKAKDSYGCIIIKGTGMDMGYYLLERIDNALSYCGFNNLINRKEYNYLGRLKY